MRYKRADVVLVFFPDSNLRTAKRRPVLVIQGDNLKYRAAANRRCHDYEQPVAG